MPKITILGSAEDNVLQPDAMRGTEHFLKDFDVLDEEQDRRDAQSDTKQSLTTTQNPVPPKSEKAS